ncbi:MAG: hypothetical protein JSW39_00855 [Desulfobacterales bacterium]|nr:MAG: hypothetical protein JSW39_00855 [Desulfobacterales bacterium]
MSVCTADSEQDRANCSFYEKSSFANRCMYFIFEEYCDSLNAQIYAETRDQPTA